MATTNNTNVSASGTYYSNSISSCSYNTTIGYSALTQHSLNPVGQKFYAKVSVGEIDDVEKELKEAQKIKKQFNALSTILIQKGILTEKEINECIEAMEVMDKLSETIEKEE